MKDAVQLSSKITFSHRLIPKPLVIYTGADTITWEYGLNMQSTPTYGGEVVQILSAFVDNCVIEGTTRSNPQLKAIAEWFRLYMEIAGLGRRSEEPVIFTYPQRGWSLPLWIKTAPVLKYETDLIAAPWSIQAQILGSTEHNALTEHTMGTYTRISLPEAFFSTPVGFGGDTGANALRLIDPDSQENPEDPANYWETLKRAIAKASTGDLGFLTEFANNPFANPDSIIAETAGELWTSVFGGEYLGENGEGSAGSSDTAYSGEGGGFLSNNNVTVKGVDATDAQLRNANTILSVGVEKKAPDKVLIAAIMTATVESVLNNLQGGDLDSAGLFQQRQSQGWGTHAQVTDPKYAAGEFYKRAIARNAKYPNEPVGELCQSIQVSAYPDAYAVWKDEATNTLREWRKGASEVSGDFAKPMKSGTLSSPWLRGGSDLDHYGVDIAAPVGTPLYAAQAATVKYAGAASGFGQWIVLENKDWSFVYGHVESIDVRAGQTIPIGRKIGTSGNRGTSTGPHLHFEMRKNGYPGTPVDPWPSIGGFFE